MGLSSYTSGEGQWAGHPTGRVLKRSLPGGAEGREDSVATVQLGDSSSASADQTNYISIKISGGVLHKLFADSAATTLSIN